MSAERPDYRTRAGREAEVIAQVEIDGGVHLAWLDAVPQRRAALARLQADGRISGGQETRPGFVRLVIVQVRSSPGWLERLFFWLGRWA